MCLVNCPFRWAVRSLVTASSLTDREHRR